MPHEWWSIPPEDWWLIGVSGFFGFAAALVVIDVIGCVRRRWRCQRPPLTHGKVDLFNDEGEGHFLSAKLPVAGLLKLIDDVNRGRFG